MPFVPEQFLSLLPNVDHALADAQSFGVIQVDDTGLIRLYNRWESEMAGVPITAAEGRNFFTQIAPCTNNRLVFGLFRDGLSKGTLDSKLDYTFTYRMKPTNVRIHLYRHAASSTNWIFVKRRAD